MSPLKLRYAFLPRPNPIRASSPKGGNPNVVSLDLVLTNPGLGPVTLRSLTIHIPVGSESARTLSTVVALPSPTYDPSAGWTITSAGSDVTLKPSTGSVAQIAGALLITLHDIPVNQTAPATVPITITETPDSGPPVVDATTYGLLKQESDFVVTSFAASPAVVYDVDQTVTLTWATTEAGDKLVYSVHSDSWWPKDCLNEGNCFTADDGRNGVPTGPIHDSDSTTFSLDVITTERDGTRRILTTVPVSVRVDVPRISPNSRRSLSRSGRLVALHWLAWGGSHCTVDLDGDPIAGAAPLDAYGPGWCWLLGGPPATHQFDVTAVGQGQAQASWPAPLVATHDPALVALGDGSYPSAVALAQSGAIALVACADRLVVVDVAGATLEPNPIMPLDGVTFLAVTPDGATAFVTSEESGALTVVDVAVRKPEPAPIALGIRPTGVAVSPDGALAVVASYWDRALEPVNLVTRKPSMPPVKIATPAGMAFTPDGATLLVASTDSQNVTPIDTKTWTPAAPIALGGAVSAITVTPDGRTAVALDPAGGMLYAIDLATNTVAWSVPVGGTPTQVVVAGDSRLALVTASDLSSVVAVDLARKAVTGATVKVGGSPQAITAAPDGSVVAVANWGEGSLALI